MAVDVAGTHRADVSRGGADGSTLCQEHGCSKWRWGIGAFLLVYLPIFWDWIPTVVVHKYYCDKEAGVWVYKTLDQWKTENPGVMETLVANKGEISKRQGDMDNYTDTYSLNHRINKIIKQQQVLSWLPVNRREQTIVDAKTNQVLGRYVDFGSYSREWDGLKFWLGMQRCSVIRTEHDSLKLRKQFSELETRLTGSSN